MPDDSSAQKPALVLIHGFRGSPIGLQAIADALSAHQYPIYTPAIPPFAGAKTLFDYSPQTYADYIAEYIRSQQIDRPILIGHSMGSIIAAATASLHTNLVHDKLILLAPISKRTPAALSWMAPLSAYLPASAVDYITTRYLFVPRDRQLFRKTMQLTNSCSKDQKPSSAKVYAAAKFSTRHSVADFSLDKDILLLTGQNDRVISPRKTQALAKRINAKTEFLPQSGHLHNYEKPLETATAILKFIDPEAFSNENIT